MYSVSQDTVVFLCTSFHRHLLTFHECCAHVYVRMYQTTDERATRLYVTAHSLPAAVASVGDDRQGSGYRKLAAAPSVRDDRCSEQLDFSVTVIVTANN